MKLALDNCEVVILCCSVSELSIELFAFVMHFTTPWRVVRLVLPRTSEISQRSTSDVDELFDNCNPDWGIQHVIFISVSVHGELVTTRHNSLSSQLHTFHNRNTTLEYLVVNKSHINQTYFISYQILTSEVMAYNFWVACAYVVSLHDHTGWFCYNNKVLLLFKISRVTSKFLPSQMCWELKS